MFSTEIVHGGAFLEILSDRSKTNTKIALLCVTKKIGHVFIWRLDCPVKRECESLKAMIGNGFGALMGVPDLNGEMEF
jgi:hypothetical protein